MLRRFFGARRPPASAEKLHGHASHLPTSSAMNHGGHQMASVSEIEALDQIPPHLAVLTADAGDLALPEEQRGNLAMLLLDANHKTVCLLVANASWNNGKHQTLRARAQSKGYHIRTEARTSVVILQFVYNRQVESTARNRQEEHAALVDEPLDPNTLLFNEIVQEAIRSRATDIKAVIRPAKKHGLIRFRINGKVYNQKMPLTADQLTGAVAAGYAGPNSRDRSDSVFNPRQSQSCMIHFEVTGKELDLRFKTQPVAGGLNVEMRILMADILKEEKWVLEDTGYALSQIREINLAVRRRGMVLVIGSTGSGKSTTLKILMEMIPGREYMALWTIEDPAEYGIEDAYQISVPRSDDNNDENPFVGPARSILRLDPDVVMIGEMRDRMLAEIAQSITLTGHKFLSTLHCESIMAGFERLTSESIGFSRQTLTSKDFLAAVIYQRLLPTLCEHCKLPAAGHLPEETALALRSIGCDIARLFTTNHDGCEHCGFTGSDDQTLAAEILTPTRDFMMLIRNGQDHEAEDLWLSRCKAPLDDPNCDGKLAIEHAMYKMLQGQIDPLVVEAEFEPFQTYRDNYERLRAPLWQKGRAL